MRTVFIVLAMFLFCTFTRAQEQDVAISVTTTGDHPMVSVSNMHNLPIEAFLISLDTGAANGPVAHIHYDIHSNYRHDVPIPPGTAHEVPLPHIIGKDLPVPTLRAVVFSDGSSYGDGFWVQELLLRRRILSDRIEEVMALLQNMSDQKLTQDQALEALQQAWKARREATASATPEERMWHDHIFYMATKNLQGNPHATGTNGKVPDFSKVLNRLQNALSGWHDDLQSAKPGPPKPSPLNSATLPSTSSH